MKTKILLGLGAIVALGAFLTTAKEAVGQPVVPQKTSVDSPLGMECILTVESQAWMNAVPTKPDPITGFYPDYSLRGKVVYWGADWVVLKDGTYENWVSRDKVLSVRVSR